MAAVSSASRDRFSDGIQESKGHNSGDAILIFHDACLGARSAFRVARYRPVTLFFKSIYTIISYLQSAESDRLCARKASTDEITTTGSAHPRY